MQSRCLVSGFWIACFAAPVTARASRLPALLQKAAMGGSCRSAGFQQPKAGQGATESLARQRSLPQAMHGHGRSGKASIAAASAVLAGRSPFVDRRSRLASLLQGRGQGRAVAQRAQPQQQADRVDIAAVRRAFVQQHDRAGREPPAFVGAPAFNSRRLVKARPNPWRDNDLHRKRCTDMGAAAKRLSQLQALYLRAAHRLSIAGRACRRSYKVEGRVVR
jgi:hypothetical protein